MFNLIKSKLKLKHFLGSLALLASLIWLAVISYPSPKLKIVFCNVGQGDAILIQKGTNQVLIDGGPNKKVLDCLANNLPFWDRTIEMVVLTHPESDHFGGLAYVLERYNLKYFLSGLVGNNLGNYETLISNIRYRVSKERVRVVNPYLGDKIKFAGMELEFLWPEKTWVKSSISDQQLAINNFPSDYILGASTTEPLNNFSLVLLLKYGSIEVLFTGDADSGIQEQILLNNSSLNSIDILKVPHHGARTSLNDLFVEILKPKVAVISVGKNSFGHPNEELIKKMENLGIKVRRTDLEGEIKYEF